jgi:hypothetical protein
MLAAVAPAAVPVVSPLAAMSWIAVVFLAHLYFVDRQLPVFDLGAITLLATAVYCTVPLLGFWFAGLRFTEFSYLPLYRYAPLPRDVGGFAWRHVLYLGCFALAYAVTRGRARVATGQIRALRSSAIAALFVLAALLLAYFAVLQFWFGVSYDPSYSDLGTVVAPETVLPLILRQLSQNMFAMIVLIKACLLMCLMRRWADWRWRTTLLLWLLAEGVLTITKMGGRTWYAMLLMAAVLLYHRLVKPLPVLRATILALVVVGGMLVYGMARDLGGGIASVKSAEFSPWATMNEFQALYGIAYEVQVRKAAGLLGPVPWQIHFHDLILLVPSQLLPFQKVDPCLGYPQTDGVGLGCVLGVVSVSLVGLDWLELACRGLLLGVLFAAIHRWYSARQERFWPTAFYLCLCLWSYYTFRASTFYFLYFTIYRFVPMLVAVRLTQEVLRVANRLTILEGRLQA